MKQFPSLFFHFFLPLMLAFLMSGCSCVSRCCDFGCPPVVAYTTPCVIDYNDCFHEFALEEGVSSFDKKRPLTPEFFDPFEPIDPNYVLTRGDILEVSIFGEAESSVENAMIAPDGNLYYAFLEGIPAAGRSPEDVGKEIEGKLKDLFIAPKVNVTPKETESLRYRVLGRVGIPGEYPFLGPVTIREAISEAGGLLSQNSRSEGDFGRNYLVSTVDLDRSFVVRNQEKLAVNFHKLLVEGDEKQNIYLRPNDYIYVAPQELPEVYVLGYVNAPQRLPFTHGLTLMSALASVGGWPSPSPYSPDLERFIVIRNCFDCPMVCEVNINYILCGKARDLYLEPGDIIYASHKHFRFLREMVYLAIDTFVGSFVGSAAEHYTRRHWFNHDNDD